MRNPNSTSHLIQIGISIYQQPDEWIRQCIQSVLAQEDFGLIQVTVRIDGPSACSGSTLTWLKTLESCLKGFKLIEGSHQLGTYGSYREIFAGSNSDFLCQLDADDWLEPSAVANCIKALASDESAPFVYTDYLEVTAASKPVQIGGRTRHQYNDHKMLVEFITFHLRVVRRWAYSQCGGYRGDLQYTGDYDLSLRLCEISAPLYLQKPLYNYRVHEQNTSSVCRQALVSEAFQVATKALTRRRQDHIYSLHLDTASCSVSLNRRKGPIMIAGMHRSGTSLLALILQSLGLSLGNTLLESDVNNPDGYGEDISLVKIHQELFQRSLGEANSTTNRRGWPDWGWTERVDFSSSHQTDSQWEDEARAYIKAREDSSCDMWGFKDPRATLLIDRWLCISDGLKVVAVYRDPWSVVDALQRVQPPVFAQNPEWGLAIWCSYNKSLIRFARQYPHRCILIHSSALVSSPESIILELSSRWNWPLAKSVKEHTRDIEVLIRKDRLVKKQSENELAELHQNCSPHAASILRQLDSLATIPRQEKPLQPASCSVTTLTAMKKYERLMASVIITSYNKGDLLIEAVASVEHVSKAFQVEVIIVDDGSTHPRTLEVLSRLEDSGYHIKRQSNSGVSAARNAGLHESQSDLVIFLDDDNRLRPGYLDPGVRILHSHPELDVLYGNYIEFGQNSGAKRVGTIRPSELWKMNKIDNCTLMRRSFIDRCGGYDEALDAFEDWDIWLTALGSSKGLSLGYLDLDCFEYRVRPNSMLRRLFSDQKQRLKIMTYLRQKHGERVGDGGLNRVIDPP